jgi:hypothetical protein
MLAYDAKLLTEDYIEEKERVQYLMSPVFESIKMAASKCKFNVEYSGLTEEQIKILKEHGYSIECQEIDYDGNYINIINWKNPK